MACVVWWAGSGERPCGGESVLLAREIMAAMKPEPEDLRRLLREWRELPAGDPGLAARVAREVAAAGARPGWGAASGLSLRLALAGVAAGAVGGVALAEWRAQRVEAIEMPQRYIAWIDPVSPPPATRP